MTLSERERTLLDLETGWWRHAGDKESAIAETLGCPVGDYYAELNRLIDRPEAEAAYPLVVRTAASAARPAPHRPLGAALGLTRPTRR